MLTSLLFSPYICMVRYLAARWQGVSGSFPPSQSLQSSRPNDRYHTDIGKCPVCPRFFHPAATIGSPSQTCTHSSMRGWLKVQEKHLNRSSSSYQAVG